MDQYAAKEALAGIHHQIEAAASLAGRSADAIRLVGASKTVSARSLTAFIEAGLEHYGENRLQEAEAKWPELKHKHPTVCLHYIGTLQTNKAHNIVKMFDVIETIDRPTALTAIAKAMQSLNKYPECYIQLNIGAEPQKSGCALQDLEPLLHQAKALGVKISGLMAIPPAQKHPAPYFALLAKLGKQHGLKNLSMGMSQDFSTAIALGATHVRIGTALFGKRI